MMVYHQIKFGYKKFSGSVDTLETVISDYISSDLELENCKPIFLHDTLAHDEASPHQVGLQKVQQLRGYRLEQSLEF